MGQIEWTKLFTNVRLVEDRSEKVDITIFKNKLNAIRNTVHCLKLPAVFKKTCLCIKDFLSHINKLERLDCYKHFNPISKFSCRAWPTHLC
jgi:hypothetical protein